VHTCLKIIGYPLKIRCILRFLAAGGNIALQIPLFSIYGSMPDGCSTKDYNQTFDLVGLIAGLFYPRSWIIFFDAGYFSRNRVGPDNSSFKDMLEGSYSAKIEGAIIFFKGGKGENREKQCFLY